MTGQPDQVGTDEGRRELQAVLDSGILKKAPNLRQFLEYVAEQHFAGNADQIKEYNIAVQALHRPEHFDPQADTIVRVTAHALRKKLEQYYATEGSDHAIQLQLPAGKYMLTFERKRSDGVALNEQEGQAESSRSSAFAVSRTLPRALWITLTFAVAAVVVGVALYRIRQSRLPSVHPAVVSGFQGNDRIVRMRFGGSKTPFTDSAGQVWLTDQNCSGGSAFEHHDREIQGTDDQALFREGREGKFQCKIPAPAGEYQLTVLFADTAGDKVSARGVDFTINNDRHIGLDVVDEAGGNDVAVGKVYGGIQPLKDGAVHLDFTSEGAFVNAIELAPCASSKGAPLRMLAGPAVIHDRSGNIWGPERFFQGGRRAFHTDNLPVAAEPRIFRWERYGHFRYTIPVIADQNYKLSLSFSEAWFGTGNGGAGGIGSRLFDVYCNGHTLLDHFDILREQERGAAVKTFHGVRPTAHGILQLDFIPVTNYPLINAIEVEPEDQ